MPKKPDHHIEKTGWKELIWFVGLWATGVGAVFVLAMLIRLALGL